MCVMEKFQAETRKCHENKDSQMQSTRQEFWTIKTAGMGNSK